MRRVLVTVITLLSMYHAPTDICDVAKAIKRDEFIEENHLVRVRLSCYLATGSCCADGTWPVEGVCASNTEHLGEDVIVYNDELIPCMRLQVRDIGGNELLRQGKAIDIYRDSMDRAWQLVDEYGTDIWIQWIPRNSDITVE